MSDTAMVKVTEVAARPLVTVDEMTRTFEALRGRANILSPISSVNTMKPLHQISVRTVFIDPLTECYQDKRFCKDDEYALGGVALQKLAAAAGAQPVYRKRLDDRSDPHYCEIEMCVAVQDFDGTWRQMIGTKALDLRDGSEEAKAMLPKELANQRKQIQSMCETKAMYRAMRKLFSLRQKYTKAELARPWVVPKLVAHLDLSDPDQKHAAIQEALGSTRALFGPGPGDEVRTMRDATPARALPSGEATPDQEARREPPPLVRETPDSAPQREEPADFDLLDFTEEKEAQRHICTCPCGCQLEITPEVATATTEQVGAPRCQACYPGKSFDVGKHRDVRGTLNLPKRPNLTAADVAKALEKQTAGAKR